MRTRTSSLGLLLVVGMALVPTIARGQNAGRGGFDPAMPPDALMPLPAWVLAPRPVGEEVTYPDTTLVPPGELTAGPPLYAGPTVFRAQDSGPDVPPADPVWPLPLYHDRPEKGGFFAALEFLFWRENNPIKNQVIAVRGFVDTDGSVQATLNQILGNGPQPVTFGQFFGSHIEALNANQVGGPQTYRPGWAATAGWRFEDGTTVEFVWRHLVEAKYSSGAGFIPATATIPGFSLSDEFLFSPVFNFPPEFRGPLAKINVTTPQQNGGQSSASFTSTLAAGIGSIFIGSSSTNPRVLIGNAGGPFTLTTSANASSSGGSFAAGAAPGIWNGATQMNLSFVQRQDEYEIFGRIPVYQSDCARTYGLVGFRHVSLWERFQWTTLAFPATSGGSGTFASLNLQAILGQATPAAVSAVNITGTIFTAAGIPVGEVASLGIDPADMAIYSNIVSNQLYGPFIGCGWERYLGHGFAFNIDLRAGALLDIVHEEAKYDRGDLFIGTKRNRRDYTMVPELDAIANLWWYPIEGVQIRVGYDLMTYFNTVAATHPVTFNYGAMDPPWEKGVFRIVDGWHAGIGFIF